jgi:hypothetical protein
MFLGVSWNTSRSSDRAAELEGNELFAVQPLQVTAARRSKLATHSAKEKSMRNLLLAVAFALGLGFAATGVQAAALGSNVSALQSSAKASNSLVQKTYHRRGHWRHRPYWRHHRSYRPYRYNYRHYGWRHHRHYRHNRYWR